jgi:hypothetical protein
MVVILTVLFAGDLVRYSLSVPVWVAIVLTGTVWAIAVLWTNHVNWRQLPVPFIAVLAWWVMSPLWSPYAENSALMLVPAVITVLIGWALVVAAPIDELVRRIHPNARTREPEMPEGRRRKVSTARRNGTRHLASAIETSGEAAARAGANKRREFLGTQPLVPASKPIEDGTP